MSYRGLETYANKSNDTLSVKADKILNNVEQMTMSTCNIDKNVDEYMSKCEAFGRSLDGECKQLYTNANLVFQSILAEASARVNETAKHISESVDHFEAINRTAENMMKGL